MVSRRRFLAAGALAFLPGILRAEDIVDAMRFSSLVPGAALPSEYRLFGFDGVPRTQFTPVQDEGRTVLHARAQRSMAAVVRSVRVAAEARPRLSWRWKALRLPERSELATRAGDDFAARLYVAFDLGLSALPLGTRIGVWLARLAYGADVPAAALCYVWAAHARVGEIAASAFTERVRMVVVESGAAHIGQWRHYDRDVLADYAQAFGSAAPAVSGVAVSSDADNTGSAAEALFGDVRFTVRRTS
jgi:hypothetical protein